MDHTFEDILETIGSPSKKKESLREKILSTGSNTLKNNSASVVSEPEAGFVD